MKKTISSFFLLWMLVIALSSKAQLKPFNPTAASPNAAALGTYGEIPVSNFTGTPSVSVPIYQIAARGMTIPVTVSYHSAGVRPEQHPGWTGTGWTLNAGGAITRQVRKYADEHRDINYEYGYYYKGSILNAAGWEQGGTGNHIGNATDKRIFHTQMSLTDLEADEFSFNFLGHSGKFYYNAQTQTFSVQSDEYFKVYLDAQNPLIEPFLNGYYGYYLPKSFNKFTLEDAKGNKYIFGGTEAIEYSEPMKSAQKGERFWATSWNLIKIITANQADVIDFEYERGPYISQLYRYANYYSISSNCYSNSYLNWRNDGSFISPVYLKRIKVQGGVELDFSASASNEMKYTNFDYQRVFEVANIYDYELLNSTHLIPYYQQNPYIAQPQDKLIWLKLDGIKVLDHQQTLLREVNFTYNNIPQERLFLEEIAFKSSTAQSEGKYTFLYNSKSSLPAYLGTVTDHWGFYNGNAYGNFNGSTIYSLREPNFSYASKGLLETVFYPTGGKTIFEYEPHNYSYNVNPKNRTVLNASTNVAGGSRIKKVSSYTNANTLALAKEYFYVKDYINNGTASSGILNSLPIYQTGPYTTQDMAGVTFSYTMSNSAPILPLNDGAGVHVGYTEVTEVQTDELGRKSYTVQEFTNHDNGYKDSQAEYLYHRTYAPYDAFNSRDYERGKLLTKNLYDDAKTKVKSVQNVWGRIVESTSPAIRSMEFNFMDIALACNVIRYYPSSVSYLNYTYPFVLNQEIETDYTPSGATTTTSTYAYNANKQVLEQKKSNSTGDWTKSNYAYADNFQFTSGSTSNVYAKMVAANMVGIPVEYTVSQTDGVNPDKVISSQLQTYKLANNFIVPAEDLQWVNHFGTKTPTTGNISGLSYDTGYEMQGSYDIYDQKANLLQHKAKGNVFTTYFWGYDKRYLTAKIDRAPLDGIFYADIDKDGLVLEHGTNYMPINLEKETDATLGYCFNLAYTIGYIWAEVNLTAGQYYELTYWDNGSDLAIADPHTILSQSVIEQKGPWTKRRILFTVPSNAWLLSLDANTGLIKELIIKPQVTQMTRYTYQPWVGMTSAIDPKGFTTSYEYDSFQRLQHIKDNDGNIVKSYDYRYAAQQPITIYNSAAASGSFTRNNCASNYAGGTVVYNVPAGTYSSTVSQAAADALATADVAANGQNYANTNGSCTQVVTCMQYRITIPVDESNNLYVRYKPCGSSNYVTVSLWQLEQEPSMENEVVVFLCTETPMYDIWYMYGEYGPSQFINGLVITEVGPCP